MAKLSFFLSYSRQESPFVDALLDVLEDNEHSVWVDYKKLTPGRPWLNQILAGIDAADIMLLVVSKSSMASSNVADEYKYALEKKKRILLVLFEAVPLPIELQTCEWVDFRSPFKQHYGKLIAQIEHPEEKQNAPQKGFKAPAIVWASFFISLIAILLSMPSWWTLYVPILLLPLPIQILTRDVNYYRVRFALLTLPVALFFSLFFFLSYPTFQTINLICSFSSLLISPVLLFQLSSKEMRVWGRPASSAPKFTNPYKPDVEDPEPIPFFIEYAREDKKYADALIQQLTQHKHPHVTDVEKAKVSFSLMSRYKNTTLIDPEKHILYPVIIQNTQVDDRRIQRIQWIDFRRGLRNMDSLALLLPRPMKMLEALGIAPIGRQEVYPRIIQMLDYYLSLLGFFSLSVWIPLWMEVGNEILQYSGFGIFVAINFVSTSVILTLIFFSRRALLNRQGQLASLWDLFWTTTLIGMIGLFQTTYIINAILIPLQKLETGVDMRGTTILFLPISFSIGFVLIIFVCLWNWRDLTRWFPYQGK